MPEKDAKVPADIVAIGSTLPASAEMGPARPVRWRIDIATDPIIDDKYELVRLVGEGGMGAVYEARNRDTLKRCAVKLVLARHIRDGRARERFTREVRASSMIDSDHIVQVFDSGVDPTHDVPYMVMELLDGETVADLLTRHDTLAPDTAARIALQAATGLARAHEAGIVHRDIKPSNLFIARRDLGDAVVKVLDFGIAKLKMEPQASKLTGTGDAVGTPQFMSPEQAKGDKSIDGAADVWSLGVVLYAMLTGTVPFDAEAYGALMVQLLSAEVPPVQDRAPWVDPDLAEITHRCLSRDRSIRYPDGKALRDALLAVVDDARLTPAALGPASEAERARIRPPVAASEAASPGETVPVPDRATEAALPAPDGATGAVPPAPTEQPARRRRIVLATGLVTGLALLLGALFLAAPAEVDRATDAGEAPRTDPAEPTPVLPQQDTQKPARTSDPPVRAEPTRRADRARSQPPRRDGSRKDKAKARGDANRTRNQPGRTPAAIDAAGHDRTDETGGAPAEPPDSRQPPDDEPILDINL